MKKLLILFLSYLLISSTFAENLDVRKWKKFWKNIGKPKIAIAILEMGLCFEKFHPDAIAKALNMKADIKIIRKMFDCGAKLKADSDTQAKMIQNILENDNYYGLYRDNHMIELLQKHGLKIKSKTKDGKNGLDLAVSSFGFKKYNFVTIGGHTYELYNYEERERDDLVNDYLKVMKDLGVAPTHNTLRYALTAYHDGHDDIGDRTNALTNKIELITKKMKKFNPNFRFEDGNSFLHVLFKDSFKKRQTSGNYPEQLVEKLKEKGVTYKENNKGETPLFYVNDKDAAKTLNREFDINQNKIDKEGNNALLAIIKRHLKDDTSWYKTNSKFELIRFLINAIEIDPSLPNNALETSLSLILERTDLFKVHVELYKEKDNDYSEKTFYSEKTYFSLSAQFLTTLEEFISSRSHNIRTKKRSQASKKVLILLNKRIKQLTKMLSSFRPDKTLIELSGDKRKMTSKELSTGGELQKETLEMILSVLKNIKKKHDQRFVVKKLRSRLKAKGVKNIDNLSDNEVLELKDLID